MKKVFKRLIVIIITNISRAILWQHEPYIIAITGNIGKTTTKDSIVAGLSNLHVRGSNKSLNSDIGVPLTIIGADNPWSSVWGWLVLIIKGVLAFFSSDYPEYLVLEVGADQKGDIKNMTKWLTPSIAVITQFAQVPVHISNFDNNRELLIEEKESLAVAATDLIVYNGDDIDCQRIAHKALTLNPQLHKVSFGRGMHNTLILRNAGNSYDLHSVVGTIEYDQRLYKVAINDALGDAAVISVMPAILMSIYLNGDKDGDVLETINDTIARLNDMKRQRGRMSPLYGINNTLIIDDSYNSSPKALENGLDTLLEIGVKYRRIVVLGDMKELGDRSEDEHYRVGRLIPACANMLLTLGDQASHIARGALDAGMRQSMIIECLDAKQAITELKQILKVGDIVYIKGSQSMRMEKIVKEVLDHESHNYKEVLARQEKEWQKR